MIIEGKKYGLNTGEDISEALIKLLDDLRGTDEEKVLVLERGEYYLDSSKVIKRKLFVTNTIGDNEWKKGEIPHNLEVGINIDGIKNLTIEGNGAMFVVNGEMTNVAVTDSENITLKNFAIGTVNPDMHELKVVSKGIGYVDFELDEESRYIQEDGKFYFVGQDYKVDFFDNKLNAFWIGRIREQDIDTITRVSHPLMGAFSLKETGRNRFRARYFIRKPMRVGDRFYLFDVRRKYVGIFVDDSKDVVLDGVMQHFNYSLALVCQNTENVTMRNCKFAPYKDSKKLMASVADFIQICMCRGLVDIDHNEFLGSGDDCINVHGIHFKIASVNGNDVIVRFSHPQSHGFNPLRAGDTVRFVNPVTLLGDNTTEIISSELINEFDIKLTLKDASAAVVGEVIEDLNARPDLTFANNVMTRIITRGALITTGGKVRVHGNKFLNTSMNAILISDDAKSWYESGNVEDVVIEGNYFGKCPERAVMIKPENSIHRGYVHHNITIRENVISEGVAKGIYVKSSDKVVVEKNNCARKLKFAIKNSDVKIKD